MNNYPEFYNPQSKTDSRDLHTAASSHFNGNSDNTITMPTKKKNSYFNNHKTRNGIIALTVLSLLFISYARHTQKTEENLDKSEEYEISQYNDTSINALTDEEIDRKLLLLSENDTRYAEIYENKERYSDSILQSVCRNPEIVDFTLGYLTKKNSENGGITDEEISEKVPLFIQWDSRWGYIPYGDDVIGYSGCGPTCLSMVAVSLTGQSEYSPKYVADFAMQNGYYEFGSGTTWSLMTEGCEKFGLTAEEVPLNQNLIFEELEQGKPIICSMSPGDFTAVGHFIVLSGIEDGKIKVNDPNSRNRSARLWSYEELEWQIRNLWAFSKSL